MTTISFKIPAQCWLTSNRHIAVRAQLSSIRTRLHEIAAFTAHGHEPIPTPCVVLWEVCYPKGVGPVADAGNAQPTTKALLDGLVKAGLIALDDARGITHEVFTRGPNHDLLPTGYGDKKHAQHLIHAHFVPEITLRSQ